MIRHAIMALACLLAPVAHADVLFKGDFETGNIAQWGKYPQFQPGTTDRLVVQSEITADPVSQFALAATVKYGDLHSNGARAEVVLSKPRFYEGDDVWYRWQTLFPADFVSAPRWHVWTQWHQGDNGPGGSPPVEFTLSRETLSLVTNDGRGGRAVVHRWPLERGVWREYVLHAVWSQKEGLLELFIDGELVATWRGPTLQSDGLVYLKQGLYRDRSIEHTQTVFHDGMTAATSLEDLYPPVVDPPAPPEPEVPPAPVTPPAPAVPDAGAPPVVQLPDLPSPPREPGVEPVPPIVGRVGCSAGPGSPFRFALYVVVGLAALHLIRRRSV